MEKTVLFSRNILALYLTYSKSIFIESKNWNKKVKFLLNYLANEFESVLDA